MQFTLTQRQTSKPITVSSGTNITVTPSSGATALVEYTTGTADQIANGTATWSAWGNGTVSASAKDKLTATTTVRVTANNGMVYVDINDVPVGSVSSAQIIYDSSNKASLVDAAGNVIKLSGSVATSMGSGARFVTAASAFSTNAGSAVGRVLDVQHPALADFIGVRLVYANWDTTAVMTINAAKVAASSAHMGNISTTGPAGGAFAWSDFVTFNGSTTATVPMATAGVGGSVMPHLIPGLLVSDFVAVDSIARTDGGSGPLLRVRTHINDNSWPMWATFTTQNADSNGLLYAHGAASSAVGTLTSAAVTMGVATNYNDPIGVIFVYKSATVKTLAVFGDSLSMAGAPTTVSGIGWPGRVTVDWWNTGGTIISAMNFAENGQTLEDSHSILRAYCALHQPTYCAFYAFSPNSTGRTAANFLTRWAMVLNTISFLESKGIKPVLMTSTPVETYSQAEKDQITLQNNRIKALSDRITVIDGASIVSDGSLFYSQYKYDVTHYNDAGHKAIGALAYNALK